MHVVLPTVVLLVAGLAGCVGGPGEGPGSNEPDFPSRSDNQSKPVLLLHGFNIAGNSDATTWNYARAYLTSVGFTGPIQSVAYYGCDAGFDLDSSMYGPHDGSGGDSCGFGGHSTDTGIQHLAQHFAWMVHDLYAVNWQCVDVLAHSMGGLVLRLALDGVERGVTGFPPEMCVEDAVTMGTPHAGAGLGGSFCAGLLGYVQCQQMTSPDFLNSIAQQAPRPMGSHVTDWTTIGSVADGIITWDSAKQMAAASITFLSTIDHTGAYGYQLIDPLLTQPVQIDDGTPRVILDAPGPLSWAATALESTTFTPAGESAPLPVVTAQKPAANVLAIPGQSIEFQGACQNENYDTLGGQWWTRSGTGPWHGEAFDKVNLNASPWVKSQTYQFPSEGEWSVKFVCVNQWLGEASVQWGVSVDVSNNDVPTALRVSPAQSSGTLQGRQLYVEATCSNPNHDLSGARWAYRQSAGAWTTLADDTVQFHADPWMTNTNVNFPGDGTYEVRATCIDDYGASSEVVWAITVQAPPGPTAYRYSPNTASGSVSQGQTIEFQAGCSNPNGDLERGEWWAKDGGGVWTLESTDTVNWASDPWEKSRSYTFSGTGQYGVEFRCINEDGGTGAVTWAISSS